MNPETQFLYHLRQRGYFAEGDYDPQPVLDAARKYLGIDARTAAGSDRLNIVINGLVQRGAIRFEYSRDPTQHPKDILDYWRLLLTPVGAAELEREGKPL